MKTPLLATLLLTICSFSFAQSNFDFENWETINGFNPYEEPQDWNSSNACSAIINQFSVTKSTDAHAGSFSAKLETMSAAGIMLNGVLTTSQMICLANGGGQEGGSVYSGALPDSVVGWFKYAPVNNDSAYVQLMFLANNDMDTISFTRHDFTENFSGWTRFSFPVPPAAQGQNVEKMSLLFNSSWGDGSQGEAEIGSTLYIDDIELVYNSSPVGINDHSVKPNTLVYPNPTDANVFLNFGIAEKKLTVSLFNAAGSLISVKQLNSVQTYELQLPDIKGLYFLEVLHAHGKVDRLKVVKN